MSARPYNTTEEAKFRAAVEAMVRKVLRPRGFVIPNMQVDPPETDQTNLWMRYDGRLRGRYWNGASFTYVDYPMRSDITSPPAVPASPSAPAVGAVPSTYRATWTANWSQSYQGNDTKRTDSIGEQQIVFGSSGTDAFGQQKALVGFDYTAIAAALASSTIQKAELTVTSLGSTWSTVQVYFGAHNLTAEPTLFDGTVLSLRKAANARLAVGTQTVQLPIAFAMAMRAGTAKGLAFEAPSADREFYGRIAGVGSGYTAPQLTITYAK